MKRIGLSVIAVVVFIFTIVTSLSCYAGEERGVGNDTVKVGFIMDQTGPAASIAVTIIEGVRSLIQYQNDQGGIHGRKIKLIVEDDRYSIPSAISAFKKLLFKDEVFALTGPSSTGAFSVIASRIRKEKVPFISIVMPEITVKPFKRYVFIFTDIYPNQMKVLVDYTVKDLKQKDQRIALVYPDNETGKIDSASAIERLALYNIKPVAKEVLSPAAFDASSQAMNLRRAKTTSVILCGMIPPPATVILRDLKKFGLSIPIFGSWATCVEEVIQMAGEAAGKFHAINSMSSWYDDGPGVAKMRKITLKYRPGTEKPYRGKLYTQGWVMSVVLLEGLDKAGRRLDTESFIHGLEGIKNLDTGGLTGPISFSSSDHKGGSTWKIFKADPSTGMFSPMTGWRKAE